MRRTGAFLLTMGLAALMGSSVQAQPTTAPKVDAKPAVQPASTRIIRNPPSLRLTAQRTLTHRVLTVKHQISTRLRYFPSRLRLSL